MSEMDFDDFLNHQASGGGKGGGFVGNWKDEGSIIVWPHPRATIHALWFHNWPEFDKGTREKPVGEYRTRRWVCLEHEDVLKKQRFRDRTGAREMPPVMCPICLMIEWVHQRIEAGKLDWLTPIFKFVGEEEETIIHAGGLTGAFNDRDLEKHQLKALRQAGIRQSEAFREKGAASMNYVFRVVAHDDPDEGAKIMMIPQSLGDKFKASIKGRRNEFIKTGRDAAEADPRRNPVAFEFQYHEKEQFSDKYVCERIETMPCSAEVQAAFDMDPPDVDRLLQEGDVEKLYANLVKHSLIDMPLDEFFAPVSARNGKKVTGEATDETEPTDDEDDDDFADEPVAKGKTGKAAPPVEMVECDVCKKAMPETDLTCPHCGAEYEEKGGEVVLKPKPEPAKPIRTRIKRS